MTPRLTLMSKVACMTLILAAGIILTIVNSAHAEKATSEEMDKVCSNWLNFNVSQKGSWAGSASPEIIKSEDITYNDMVIAKYYAVAPNGYVVVPVLKELPPVKASSMEYYLDFSDSDGMTLLLREIIYDRTRLFINRYGSIEATQDDRAEALLGYEHRRLWDIFTLDYKEFLAEINRRGSNRDETYGPLLTTAWHQHSPYNLNCPTGDGGQCVVGCVATAAAQIMYYWAWPPSGEGSHSYYWDGDQSCEGNTEGRVLSADFSDEYIWDDAPANLAEINYEVGVAFEMDYGRCGSGTWTYMGVDVFPTYFRYQYGVNVQYRSAYNAEGWSDIIKAEIVDNRPMQYRIQTHSIVCDGWRELSELVQIHMNYGWSGSQNLWYSIDNLYCPWEGCDPMVEYLVRNIEPRAVILSADQTFGTAPLEVNFSGESELTVDTWTWDLGDGEYAYVQSPLHIYDEPGIYNITLEIDAGGKIWTTTKNDYIVATADSMIAIDTEGPIGGSVMMPIYAHNTIPISGMVIPLHYSGTLAVTFDSVSTAGCRTEGFFKSEHNLGSGFKAFELTAGIEDMQAGTGSILNTFFTIQSGDATDYATIELDDLGSYVRMFTSNEYGDYAPAGIAGTIRLPYICGDADCDKAVNILDVVYIINYIYKNGTEPDPLDAADVNSDTYINILDVVYVINFIYKSGPVPDCPSD